MGDVISIFKNKVATGSGMGSLSVNNKTGVIGVSKTPPTASSCASESLEVIASPNPQVVPPPDPQIEPTTLGPSPTPPAPGWLAEALRVNRERELRQRERRARQNCEQIVQNNKRW